MGFHLKSHRTTGPVGWSSAYHRSTRCIPALLMLRRQLRLPLDLMYPTQTPEEAEDYHEYVEKLEKRLEIASEFARRHLKIDWKQRERGRATNYKAIDLNRPVYGFNPAIPKGRTAKFARMWRGPLRVFKQINDHLFVVQGGREPRVIHRSHLYQPPPLMQWLSFDTSARHSVASEEFLERLSPLQAAEKTALRYFVLEIVPSALKSFDLFEILHFV